MTRRRRKERTILLVASTGGHLAEMVSLSGRFVRPTDRTVWVTFDSPQSRSLLAGREVQFVRYTAPRDYLSVAVNVLHALRLLLRYRPRAVVSTGAAVALSFLPLSVFCGARSVYVESAARSQGPSRTGRILSSVPWVKLYTQYRRYARGRWQYGYSVFDDYEPDVIAPTRVVEAPEPASSRTRVLVLLGTLDYPFPALVDRLVEILPGDVDVAWQLGCTSAPPDVPGTVHRLLSTVELASLVHECDVLVAHSGCGTALLAMESGKAPVLVPRRVGRGEHVDDHQVQIARELAGRGLARYREVGDLCTEDLLMRGHVRRTR
jgi:UDP-N-acetylglucosamine--N-acetylmuramyl-(pentapeptide) pyrophosphoryl-undecaprenol N-acetylglucosamine transferase